MFGLSFLNTLFLWGLAAAAIPVLIHLIKRNRAVKLPFAAMRFLQLDPNQHVKSQKLKQLLLLLMRITALALLALAFARPFFKNAGTAAIWGNGPKAAVILVDNSFSMGRDNLLATAVAKANDLLKSFKPGDQVSVIQFSERAETLVDTEREFGAAANLLESRVALSNRGTNFLPAIQAAETRLLELPFTSKTIYLISDFQAAGLDNVHFNWKLQPGVSLELLPVGNRAASNAAVREVLISAKNPLRKQREVLARIKNFGQPKKKVEVSLVVNGRRAAQKNLTLAAEEEKIVEFNNVTFPSGAVSGYMEIQANNESILQDNRYFFVVETMGKGKILAVNGEPHPRDVNQDELFFVERAVNLPELAKYELIQTTPQKLSGHEFSDYQVILFANVKEIARETIGRIIYYVRGGGGVLIALGDQTIPTIFNQLFRELSPAALNHLAFESIQRERSVILAEVDYQHPIFRKFSDSGQGDPGSAQVYQYFQAEPISSESVLARFDDGSPALLERTIGSGKVILFTSSFDTEWTNLPVKPIFLPLLYQTIQYAAAEKKGQKSYLVGQPVNVQAYSEEKMAKGEISVRLPSGESSEIASPIFENTPEPGIYEIQRHHRNRTREYFAVNVDTRESDITAMALEDLQARFVVEKADMPQTASMGSPNVDQLQEHRQKLWRLAILAVIVLLLGETWLGNRTYR